MPTLVFVDTNILLDFYRFTAAKDASESLLRHIDRSHSKIITSHQVEMEFTKNRQRVLIEAMRELKEPSSNFQIPAFLRGSAAVTKMSKMQKKVAGNMGRMRDSIRQMLREPATHDPVYKTAKNLFRSADAHTLARDNAALRRIESLAFRRFLRGEPPRKAGDTSYGDAINWEWIIRCAMNLKASVVIVSRDSDYGVALQDKPTMNDWLDEEFQRRVGGGKTIELTDRLSEGLGKAGVKVAKKAKAGEAQMIEARKPTVTWRDVLTDLRAHHAEPKPDLDKFFAEWLRQQSWPPSEEE